MSRQPPSLSYLTIYNPSIKPADSEAAKGDEDAEEQAQILFYTGKERAVSRDRILRQVGLAKALVNFAGMFSGSEMCESTHSQARRMIMVSPEPNFWIHACVDLAKTPRQPKTKPVAKGKSKESAAQAQEILFEYHDDSVHDAALREQILTGYRDFVLLHGSFTSILETLGQTALELQLERFFTVWAWQWELEEGRNFGEHLGVPLHPAYHDVIPLLDRFTESYLSEYVTFLLSPPHLLPSTALINSQYPATLATHILRRIPPPPRPSESPAENDSSTEKADTPVAPSTTTTTSEEKKMPEGSATGSKMLANPFANMDVRNLKWMWSGLTLGKNPSPASRSSTPAVTSPPKVSEALPPSLSITPGIEDSNGKNRPELSRQGTEVEVDAESLLDAIESELSSAKASPTDGSPVPPVPPLPHHEEKPEEEGSDTHSERKSVQDGDHTEGVVSTEVIKPEEHGLVSSTSLPERRLSGDHDKDISIPPTEAQEIVSSPLTARPREHELGETVLSKLPAPPLPKREPGPTFLSTTVFLPKSPSQRLDTVRKRVLHATKDSFTFAVVVEEDHQIDVDGIAGHLHDLFDDVQEALNAAHERDSQGSVFTVTKILEPQDRHIVSLGEYTISSTGFTSTSEHLFNARDILRSELDVLEVFSRGQNPQHWHIGRREPNADSENRLWQGEGEVYMEVARKESTLTDVDNGLAGVTNRL